jgi:hypothetical protein
MEHQVREMVAGAYRASSAGYSARSEPNNKPRDQPFGLFWRLPGAQGCTPPLPVTQGSLRRKRSCRFAW